MRCQNYESLFSQYIDCELPLEERDALRFHINGCPRCQQKLEDMQNAVFAMHKLNSLTPRPEFDATLKSNLKSEVTNELYGKSIWPRWVEAFEDLYRFGRQRTVQAVFTVSLLLTVAVGLSFSLNQGSTALVETARLSLPELIEPELAAMQLTMPVPLENAKLAPVMTLVTALAWGSAPVKPSSNSVMLSNIVPEFNVETLLPLPSGELNLANFETGSKMRTASLGDRPSGFSLNPFSGNNRVLTSANALSRSGFIHAGSQTQLRAISALKLLGGQRYILPSVPSKKRITRVSF